MYALSKMKPIVLWFIEDAGFQIVSFYVLPSPVIIRWPLLNV